MTPQKVGKILIRLLKEKNRNSDSFIFSEKLDNLTSMKAVLGQKGELVTPGWLLNNVMNFAFERK